MSYGHLIDFIGDLRAPEHLDCPPGGSAGCICSDAYLREIAERAKASHDPQAYLRGKALELSELATPGNWQCAALTRVSAWCREFHQSHNLERNAA